MSDRLYINVPRLDVLEFLQLVQEEYPTEPDRRIIYKKHCDEGLRFGQAFMNSLRETPYYEQLTGSLVDPFYKNNYSSIMDAIEFLFKKN